jgi:hypothetical protein
MEYTAQQHMILIGIEDAWGLARLKEVMIGKQLVSLPSSITRKNQEKKKKKPGLADKSDLGISPISDLMKQ